MANVIIPRPYQTDAKAAAWQYLDNHDSTLMVMATGAGKTVVFAMLADEWFISGRGRVLILAHREELLTQGRNKIHEVTGVRPGLEMAEYTTDESVPDNLKDRFVMGSVQTLARANRREKYARDTFGLIVVDEAHHAVANSYRDIFSHFSSAKRLGVTATPKRADQLALGMSFDSCCYELGIEKAIAEGWLCPVRQKPVYVEGLDFSKVRTTAGDFNEADLEDILTQEAHLHKVAAPLVDIAGDMGTIVFCVTVRHAMLMAAVLDRYKKGCARAVSGKTPTEDRQEIMADFKSGRTQYLVNVGIATEGFDAHRAVCVAWARPTQSTALYEQGLGRVTRTWPGVIDPLAHASAEVRRMAIARSEKPFCLVLDFVGNSANHKVVTAADILGGKYAEPVKHHAKDIANEEAEDASSFSVDELLERANDELQLLGLVAAERQKREAVKAQAKYRTENVSIFGRDGSAATPVRNQVAPKDPATGPQIYRLIKLGCSRDFAENCSKQRAGAIIGQAARKGK